MYPIKRGRVKYVNPPTDFGFEGMDYWFYNQKIEEEIIERYKIGTDRYKEGLKEEILEEIGKRGVIVIEPKPYAEAKHAIIEFLKEKAKKGVKKIDDITIMEETQLPIEQIDKIMEELQSEKKVKDLGWGNG